MDALVLALAAYALSRRQASETSETSGRSVDEETPSEAPIPVEPTLPEYRIEAEWTSDDGTIKVFCLEYLTGNVYEYPTTGEQFGSYEYEMLGYIIGNATGTGFTRASGAVGGTTTFDLNGVIYENVIVYATLDGAILDAEEEEEEEEQPPIKPPSYRDPTIPGFGGWFNGNNWSGF